MEEQRKNEGNGYEGEDGKTNLEDHIKKEEQGGGGGDLSLERTFERMEVPSWRKQLTVRAFVVSFVMSVLFSFIVMKLNLTTGIIPSLNVSAGLLGFFFIKTWTQFLLKAGLLKQPFTRQENTVIQTCVVASSGIAFSGTSLTFFLLLFLGHKHRKMHLFCFSFSYLLFSLNSPISCNFFVPKCINGLCFSNFL